MIVCPRCNKENQDHYKFCLGCGGELPRDAAHQPKGFTAPTPPAGFPVQERSAGGQVPFAATPMVPPGFSGAAPQGYGGEFGSPPVPVVAVPASTPPAAKTSDEFLSCPQCSGKVPKAFKFCGSCGFPMSELAPASQRPAAVSKPASIPPAAVSAVASRGQLVSIRQDGTEGDSTPLTDAPLVIGRDSGGAFAADSYLSPKHATFSFKGKDLFVKDEDSLNGIYYRLERDVPVELVDGSVFRMGHEIIRFEKIPTPVIEKGKVEPMGSPNPGYLGRLTLVIGRDTPGTAFCIPPTGMHLGRERGDVLFPEDGYVSGLHCRISLEGDRMMLTDVGSSNGTYIRLRAENPVKSGGLVLMGQQLFRAEY